MLADFDQRLGDGGQLGGRRVEDDAVVEDPLCGRQKRLRRAEPLLLDVLLHGAQVHGACDVVLVGGELRGVDRLGEGLHPGHGLHPAEGVLE